MLYQLGSFITKLFGENEENLSYTRDIYTQMADFYTLSDFLPFDHFDTNRQLFINDHSWGFVIETAPLVGCSEAMQKEINNIFSITLPEDSSLQTILFADPDISLTLHHYINKRNQISSSIDTLRNTNNHNLDKKLLHHLAEQRAHYLCKRSTPKENIPQGAPIRNIRCILAYSTPRTSNTPKENLKTIQDHIISTLEMMGLPVHIWCPTDLLNFLNRTLYPTWNNKITLQKPAKWNQHERISYQVRNLESHIRVRPAGLNIHNNIQARTYTVTSFPDEWSLHAMSELIGDFERDQAQIPCPFIFHYGVHVPSQHTHRQKIRVKSRYIDKQAHSPIGKYLTDIQRENAELNFVREQLNKGEKIVQTQFSITLFGTDESIDRHESKLINLFTSREWKIEKNHYLHLPIFLSQIPMMWGANYMNDLRHLHKIKTTLSTEAANLIPLQGEWKGTPTPAMLLTGRRGQLMTWCPFDNMAGNYNVCVVGRSGSGKSVFMQELMISTLGLGGRVFVLDVGRSFEKTCSLLGGQFIAFDSHQNVNLNPFAAIPANQPEVADDMLAMLKSVLFLMASPRDHLRDKDAALIEQAMCDVWRQHQNKGSISHIVTWLQNCDDQHAHDLAHMLFPYTEKGTYGKYVHGDGNPLSFQHPLVVLEMEELKERKDLQSVIIQMMIIHISHKMFSGNRSTPFHIVLDEAWDLLRGKQSGAFIETLARRLRKYRGSLVVGTQSINDFFINPGAQAAFDNSDWMCLLSQKPESIDQLKKSDRLSLSPQKETLLKSLKTQHGQYAEVMISGADGYAVGRLTLDPFSQLLYSTQANDYTTITQLTSSGVGIYEALEQILRERGHHILSKPTIS